MDGADLCFEIVNRVHAGFVYSEAVARWVLIFWFYPLSFRSLSQVICALCVVYCWLSLSLG